MSGERAAGRRNALDVLLLGALLAVFAARFHAFLAGGVFAFRDAGSFFLPLREVLSRLLRAGELPAWNDWLSHGRALAADPNGAVFWPLSPLHAWLSPSAVVLLHVALALVLFFAALRLWGLPAAAAAAGGGVLLFSGVFQALPILFTTLASALPLPLFVVLLSGVGERGKGMRRAAGAGLLLGISLLGGEPVVTALGAFAGGLVVLAGVAADRSRGGAAAAAAAGRRLGLALAAALLAAGTAAVQLLPTLAELPGSARGRSMRPEDGALFWSVRPARLLTLLEPRLTGDPFAEDEDLFWGAATFDAGNPYFYDLSIGLLPLALALASAGGRRGRSALLLAGAGALVASGRFLPGFAAAAAHAPFLRYPEKGWILATFALSAAAACGVADLAGEETRATALRRLTRASLVLASVLGGLAFLAAAAPSGLRALLWGLGLGAGGASAGAVASFLLPLLASGAASALLLGLGAHAFATARLGGRRGATLAVSVAAFVFLLDGARRVAGTCPATPPGALRAAARSEEVVAVLSALGAPGGGRFYDDGADDRGVAVARARERDGLDLLRPATGVLAGVRYAGENDIDRMTPAFSFDWVRLLSNLPWGEEKVARLRAAGVTVARTRAALAGVPGTRTVARAGQDRIVAIDGARAAFALLPEGRLVPPGASLPFAPDDPVVEIPGARPGPARFAPGTVTPVVLRPSFQRLELSPERGERLLFVARTFDPSWRARADGREVRLLRADGFLSALVLPDGTREVTLSYENHRIRTGALATAASVLAALVLAAFSRAFAGRAA